MREPQRLEVADGVTFLALPETRFTTFRLTVNMYLPLAKETAGQYAILPFLLRRGCREYPDMTAFQRALDRLYGAYVSGSVSRAGETQALTLSMAGLEDRFALNGESVSERCARLMLSLLFEPPLSNGAFRLEDVEQERRCLLETIASEINDKRRYARTLCERLMCEGEPYAVPVNGSAEQVASLTAASLTAAWRDVLRKAPMQIFYQGSGDVQTIAGAFREKLSGRRPVPLPPVMTAPARAQVAVREERMDVNQCQLVLGYRTPVFGDHPLVDAMRIAVAVFGGTPNSLLFMNVREKLSLCYYCSAAYDYLKGVMLVNSGLEEKNMDLAREEIARQFHRLQSGDFTDDALEQARLAVLDSLNSVEDSAASTAAWYASQTMNAHLRTPAEVAASVRGITREQVLAAAGTIGSDCMVTLLPKEGEA